MASVYVEVRLPVQLGVTSIAPFSRTTHASCILCRCLGPPPAGSGAGAESPRDVGSVGAGAESPRDVGSVGAGAESLRDVGSVTAPGIARTGDADRPPPRYRLIRSRLAAPADSASADRDARLRFAVSAVAASPLCPLCPSVSAPRPCIRRCPRLAPVSGSRFWSTCQCRE